METGSRLVGDDMSGGAGGRWEVTVTFYRVSFGDVNNVPILDCGDGCTIL